MDASKNYYLQVFEGKTKISTDSYPETYTIETVRFSPLPHESIIFYFEAHLRKVCDPITPSSFNFGLSYPITEFLLKLKKQPSSKLDPSLLMNLDVEVYYFDGSIFERYQLQSDIKVDQMNSFAFEKISKSINLGSRNSFDGSLFSDHSIKVRQGALTLKCKMVFKDDSSRTVIPSQEDIASSSNFCNNLKSIYESNVFKDFVFNVGEKSFPVHKVILVAHSPVFMKMMTQDCLESKTNSVTITDTTPDIFELFLKYFYSGEIGDKSWPSVRDLYCLADMYDVVILKKDCIDVIVALISLDLVCEILKLAYTYEDSSLKSAAKNFSVDHIKELISGENWKDLILLHPIIGYEIIVNFVPK